MVIKKRGWNTQRETTIEEKSSENCYKIFVCNPKNNLIVTDMYSDVWKHEEIKYHTLSNVWQRSASILQHCLEAIVVDEIPDECKNPFPPSSWFDTGATLWDSRISAWCLHFFVHAVLSPDSWPLCFFQNFRSWPQNSLFSNSLQSVIMKSYFFWWISIFYSSNTVLSFSNSRIFNLRTLSKMSSDGICVIDNRIPSHFESNSWISSFRRAIVNKSA